jgi:predicted nucleic acid-binding protein
MTCCTVKTEHGKECVSSFDVLIDSDAFIGWIYPDDPHFQDSATHFERLRRAGLLLATTTMVVDEVATVLSHRKGQELAITFLDMLERRQFPIIPIDDALRTETYAIFCQQTRRGTSVTDCANVAVMKQFDIPQIFAFDKVYTAVFNLKNVVYKSEKKVA